MSVGGKDCKWSKHAEVVQLLKGVGDEGVDVAVITLLYSEGQSMVTRAKVLGALGSRERSLA